VAHYYLPGLGRSAMSEARVESVNWAGVLTGVVAAVLAHGPRSRVMPIGFFTTLLVPLVLYPALRLTVLRAPGLRLRLD
jgi:cytosine permease